MITPGTPRRHLQDRVAGTVACTPGTPMLEVSDLVKRYGGVLALDGCSLQVPAGHLVGLLGPNGAGKTTVMRTLFGLVLPDAGTVRWRGRPVDARAWRRFGYMPEERGLYPAMRVGEQIAYFGRLSGLSTRDAAAAAGRWMARLGLAGREDSRIDRLSHGNQQRPGFRPPGTRLRAGASRQPPIVHSYRRRLVRVHAMRSTSGGPRAAAGGTLARDCGPPYPELAVAITRAPQLDRGCPVTAGCQDHLADLRVRAPTESPQLRVRGRRHPQKTHGRNGIARHKTARLLAWPCQP